MSLLIERTSLGYTVTRPSGFSFSFWKAGNNAEVSACEVITFLLQEKEKLKQALEGQSHVRDYP